MDIMELEDLREYVLDHLSPGSFLRAVLENDLVAAVAKAPPWQTFEGLREICEHIWKLPSFCWGNKALVEAWLERRQTKPLPVNSLRPDPHDPHAADYRREAAEERAEAWRDYWESPMGGISD